MDVASICSLHAAGFVWQPTAGSFAQTVMVKATFRLEPVESPLAPDQEALNEEDNHWNDDPTRSVVAPSDWAPFKPRADVLLVGHAFAPGKQPTRTTTVRMVVGELDKSIEVWCDRGFRLQDNQLLEGPRFTKMPLRWERAAGGPETNNPVGMRFDAPPDKYGMVPLPNLQPPGMYVSQRADVFAPVGFAPLGSRWPSRMAKLGRLGSSVFSPGWEGRPLPEGLDYSYFQSAPPDQQVSELRPNERITLENLHPDHSRLVTSLPGIRPRVLVERATGEQEEVALIADTLFIDTDRGICTLVWRGRVGLRSADEKGRITVSIAEDAPDSVVELGADELEEAGEAQGNATEGELATMTLAPALVMQAVAVAAMPFAGGSGPSSAPPASREGPKGNDAALPFGRGGAPPPHVQALLASSLSASAVGTIILSEDGEKGAVPPAVAAPSPPAPPAPPPPLVNPPPLVMNSPGAQPAAIATPASPWARGDSMGKDPGLANPGPGNLSPVSSALGGVGFAAVSGVSTGADSGKGSDAKSARSGAAAASDAAAKASDAILGLDISRKPGGSAKPLAQSGVLHHGPVELLWVNAASLPRIRKQEAWKSILADVKPRPDDEDLDDDLPPPKRIPPKDRRDTLAILSKGDALDTEGIEAALRRAMDVEGGFIPPLVVASGELELQFDELETLKATLAAVSPHAATDKKLKEVVDATTDLFKAPWAQGANSVLEELTRQLRDVFAQGHKDRPAGYLDDHIERTLLDHRHFQKRTVLGQPRLRCLFSSGMSTARIPAYLPESLSKDLPAFRRFPVRLIAEVKTRLEQQDVHVAAMRVVAVGRIIQ